MYIAHIIIPTTLYLISSYLEGSVQAADQYVAWDLAAVIGSEQDPCKCYLELPTTLKQPEPITH